MKTLIRNIKKEINLVIGTTAEDLEYECETTTCLSIVRLYPMEMHKITGTFNGKGHFWLEVEGEIVDLSIEQFGYEFAYPIKDQRKSLYLPQKREQVTQEIYEDSLQLSLSSGFSTLTHYS